MKILTRYVLKQFFAAFILSITAFIALFLIVDIFENIGKFVDNPVPVSIILAYFLSKIPFMLFISIPLSVMLSALVSIGLMGKNLELVAIRTSGLSHLFIVKPLLIIAIIISFVSFFGDEYVVPKANRLTVYLDQVKIKKKIIEIKPEYQLDKIWVKRGNTIYYIDRYHPEIEMLEGITIYKFNDDFQLEKRFIAEKGYWKGDDWEFHNVIENDFPAFGPFSTEKYEVLSLGIAEKPEDFKIVFEETTENMSYRELSRYIKALKKDGYNASRYKVDLMAKVSYPMVNFILVLLAIPFAIMVGRRGGIASSVVIAFTFAFLYWIVYSTCLSLGHAGTLPPILAAWTANVLFTIGGVYLFLTVTS
jgi:lipopolysaccharide export system permease protein